MISFRDGTKNSWRISFSPREKHQEMTNETHDLRLFWKKFNHIPPWHSIQMTKIANIDNNTVSRYPFYLFGSIIHQKTQARSCGRCLGTPSCCGGVGVAQPVACRGLGEVVVGLLLGNPPAKMAPKFTIVWFCLLLLQSFFRLAMFCFNYSCSKTIISIIWCFFCRLADEWIKTLPLRLVSAGPCWQPLILLWPCRKTCILTSGWIFSSTQMRGICQVDSGSTKKHEENWLTRALRSQNLWWQNYDFFCEWELPPMQFYLVWQVWKK